MTLYDSEVVKVVILHVLFIGFALKWCLGTIAGKCRIWYPGSCPNLVLRQLFFALSRPFLYTCELHRQRFIPNINPECVSCPSIGPSIHNCLWRQHTCTFSFSEVPPSSDPEDDFKSSAVSSTCAFTSHSSSLLTFRHIRRPHMTNREKPLFSPPMFPTKKISHWYCPSYDGLSEKVTGAYKGSHNRLVLAV